MGSSIFKPALTVATYATAIEVSDLRGGDGLIEDSVVLFSDARTVFVSSKQNAARTLGPNMIHLLGFLPSFSAHLPGLKAMRAGERGMEYAIAGARSGKEGVVYLPATVTTTRVGKFTCLSQLNVGRGSRIMRSTTNRDWRIIGSGAVPGFFEEKWYLSPGQAATRETLVAKLDDAGPLGSPLDVRPERYLKTGMAITVGEGKEARGFYYDASKGSLDEQIASSGDILKRARADEKAANVSRKNNGGVLALGLVVLGGVGTGVWFLGRRRKT